MKQEFQKANRKLYTFYLQQEGSNDTTAPQCCSLVIVYFILLCLGFIVFFEFNFFESYESSLHAPLYLYQILLGGITILSYYSSKKFDESHKIILEHSKDVISDDMQTQVENHLDYTKEYAVIPAAVVALCLSMSFLFFSSLKSVDNIFLLVYAGILSTIAAFSSAMAYISLINLIVVIHEIYRSKFKKYVIYYPISTDIFQHYNRVIVSGLVRFWSVSILLLSIIFFMVGVKGVQVITVISFIILGFILFTLYPFYFTQVKISELKMQTIATIVDSTADKDGGDANIDTDIIKMVQNSPSQTSSNFQMLFWSTAVAGCSFALERLLTPLLSTIGG